MRTETKITQAEKASIHDYLTLWYRGAWGGTHTDALVREFAYVDGPQLLEAVRRHVHGKGEFPPRPSDIEEQLTAMYQERQRAKQEARQKELRQESDTHYQEILGHRQSKSERARAWCALAQAESRKALRIRSALADRYGLDYRAPACQRLLMAVLTEARTRVPAPGLGQGQELEGLLMEAGPALEATKEIAQSMGFTEVRPIKETHG